MQSTILEAFGKMKQLTLNAYIIPTLSHAHVVPMV